MLIEIKPFLLSDAQLKVRRFYYSNKLSFSLSDQPDVDVSDLTFYFIHEDTTIETIQFPIESLFSVDELWIDCQNDNTDARLYTEKVFDTYSYFIKQAF